MLFLRGWLPHTFTCRPLLQQELRVCNRDLSLDALGDSEMEMLQPPSVADFQNCMRKVSRMLLPEASRARPSVARTKVSNPRIIGAQRDLRSCSDPVLAKDT